MIPILLSLAFIFNIEDKSGFFSFLYNTWEASYNFLDEQKKHLENLGKSLFGDTKLFLMGYLPEKGETIVYGEGEVSQEVRITAINGILNQKEDWMAFIHSISASHGHTNVHSTYWPSEGWTKDLFKCLMVNKGTVSETAHALSILWRQMIEEMGGIDSPGQILHYAHSIGSAETEVARALMTPQELAKITVFTFGTPHIYRNGGFANLTHYISARDGVSMLDAPNYLRAIDEEAEHVVFLSDFSEGLPLIDHFVYTGTYRNKIEELGAAFVEHYGSVTTTFAR